MSSQVIIDLESSELDRYQTVLKMVRSVVSADEPLLSGLANITAILKEAFPKISWVGYYLFDGKELYLGPFQGKLACTKIPLGNGVCGHAAATRSTIIVPDVHQFPGHIACDAGSNSEIVVPLIKDDFLLGVLDLDSYQFDAFNVTDKLYLEQINEYVAAEAAPLTDPLLSGLFSA